MQTKHMKYLSWFILVDSYDHVTAQVKATTMSVGSPGMCDVNVGTQAKKG